MQTDRVPPHQIPPPEVLEKLKPRDCPSCGKPCIPRRGGFTKLGWFMGCPDWPKCPGKAPAISSERKKEATLKLRQCYDFINRMGGVEEARHWLQIAQDIVEAKSVR